MKRFKKCIFSAMNETDYEMCNGNEEGGMLGVNVRKMKALTMKVETVY